MWGEETRLPGLQRVRKSQPSAHPTHSRYCPRSHPCLISPSPVKFYPHFEAQTQCHLLQKPSWDDFPAETTGACLDFYCWPNTASFMWQLYAYTPYHVICGLLQDGNPVFTSAGPARGSHSIHPIRQTNNVPSTLSKQVIHIPWPRRPPRWNFSKPNTFPFFAWCTLILTALLSTLPSFNIQKNNDGRIRTQFGAYVCPHNFGTVN